MTTYCVIINGRQKATVYDANEAESIIMDYIVKHKTIYDAYVAVIENGVCTKEY